MLLVACVFLIGNVLGWARCPGLRYPLVRWEIENAKLGLMGFVKYVPIDDFTENSRGNGSIENSIPRFNIHDFAKATCVGSTFAGEDVVLRRLTHVLIVHSELDHVPINRSFDLKPSGSPFDMQSWRWAEILEMNQPERRAPNIRQIYGGLNASVPPNPCPLAFFEIVRIQRVSIACRGPLSSVNKKGINSNDEHNSFKPNLPHWCFVGLAMASLFTSFWGWYNLRNERRIGWGILTSTLGLIGWVAFVSRWLHIPLL